MDQGEEHLWCLILHQQGATLHFWCNFLTQIQTLINLGAWYHTTMLWWNITICSKKQSPKPDNNFLMLMSYMLTLTLFCYISSSTPLLMVKLPLIFNLLNISYTMLNYYMSCSYIIFNIGTGTLCESLCAVSLLYRLFFFFFDPILVVSSLKHIVQIW